MKRLKLSLNELAKHGWTDAWEVDYTDLVAANPGAATAAAVTLRPLKDGDVVHRVAAYLDTPFQNTGDNAFNTTALTLGDSVSGNRFLASQELNQNGTTIPNKAGNTTYGYYAAQGGGSSNEDNLIATFGSQSGKNVTSLNAGKVYIFAAIGSDKVLSSF